jgi:hypothetical protein
MQFPKTNATTAPRAGAIPNAIAQRATEPRGTPTAAVPGAPVSSDHRPLPGVRPSTPWISEPPSLVAPPGGSSRAAGLPRPSAFLHLPDIAHTGPDGVPSGSGVVAPFLPMLQPGVGHRPWTPRALEPLTLRTAVPPGSADVNHPPVVTSLRTPEMRFVAVGAAASRNAPVTRSDSRFLSPPVETPLDEPEDERDRRHQARVFRAEVGRDHRPVPTPLTGATAAMREERRPRVEIPDLDHLASRVYGRIKQQLAVERERRGFVR